MMGENEKGFSEKMDADLSDIAYNKVPEGAEYDVFSENIKKSKNGVLLFNDISSPNSKNTKEGAETKQKSGASSVENMIKSRLQSKAVSESADKNDEAEQENVGMEYDVFSENIKKSKNGVLLFNDISSPNSKNTKESAEIKQKSGASSVESMIKSKLQSKAVSESTEKSADASSENSGMEYDVFSENADLNPAPKRPINREYLDGIYNGGLEIPEETILMKRSDYIAAYNKVEENYREAKKETLKDCLVVLLIAVFFVILNNFLSYLHNNIMSFVVTNVLTMAVIACEISSKIICALLVISLIKKYVKAKKARQKSLDLLERKKQDLMLMGLYDLSN